MKRKEAFIKELQGLLKKYNAQIYAKDQKFRVNLNPVYDKNPSHDGSKEIHPFLEISIDYIDGDSIDE